MTVPPAADTVSAGALILVVDDERDIRDFLSFRLRRAGYRVEEASTGDQALHRAPSLLPDLLLADVGLPGLDGFALTRAIKGASETAHVRVILLTGRSRDADVESGFDAGADDYLRKPFSPDELLARVRAVLARR